MILHRVEPTIRFIAVSEATSDRWLGTILGLVAYLAATVATWGVLLLLFGMPGQVR